MTDHALEIGIQIASIMGALGGGWFAGSRHGRKKATESGDPAMFTIEWMRRAEAHFKANHDLRNVVNTHGMQIQAHQGALEEIRELRAEIADLREDIAALRGALGFERRQNVRQREGRDRP